MPFFKTTTNIFVDNSEHFDANWMDSDVLKLPPKIEWDYQREMTINDVDFWETIYESTGYAVYAAYSPYAEFYLIKIPPDKHLNVGEWSPFETYYGQGSMHTVVRRMKELELPVCFKQYWVNVEDLWLYQTVPLN